MSTDNQRAQKVLEKWGMENVDVVDEEDFKKVADNFAKIHIKNKFLKKTAIVGIIFIFAFLGLMLGTVILGIDISKDFKVKNEALVQKGNSSNVLQTGEMFYSVKLGLTAPLSTIKGIKHLKFNTKESGTLQFSVVSFYYIYGRKLTFYGVNHVADVFGDGSVEVYPIKNVNGAKRIDESQVKRTDSGSVSATGTTTQVTNSGVVMISDCQGLLNMQTSGKYSLVNNIECTLSQPLNGFSGVLNGNGHTITVHMNTNGPAALFSSVSGKIANVLLRGDISGVQDCAGFAISAYTGSIFLANGMYAKINCRNSPATNDFQSVGGIAALLRNPSGSSQQISFIYSVSQGNIAATANDNSVVSYTGSFYGRTGIQESIKTKFSFTYAASTLEKYGNNSHVNNFGFKYNAPQNNTRSSTLKRDVYVPEDCYNYDLTNSNYINMCVQWFVTYYYENQDCCSSFDSCPYVQCNRYSQVCMSCRHGYKRDERDVVDEVTEIIPTVHPICEGF